jgi:hypothetical protein
MSTRSAGVFVPLVQVTKMKTKTHPIIFLDIDGVLCTQNLWKPDKIASDGYSEFNQKCVNNLNMLVELTGAKIILTSSRRINKTVEEFTAIMQRRGFTGQILAKVNEDEQINSTARNEKIRQWINKHGLPDRYVIIDDDARLAEIGDPYIHHWVRTTYHRGLDEKALEEALQILKK